MTIENPLIKGTITASRLSETAAEAEGFGWRARCTGYCLEGKGDDADEAISDLISQIRRAHQKSRMVLRNPDKLEIDYDIIRVTATLRIGDNPNKSLADFMQNESDEGKILGNTTEEWKKAGVESIEFSSPGHKPFNIDIDDEDVKNDDRSLVRYVSEVLGFKTEEEFKKHLEEDPSRASKIDLGYKIWMTRNIQDNISDNTTEGNLQ